MRYRGAAGGAEKAHSRQRRWCLWSKPVNLGTDVGTRARPHSDGTCLCRARVWHSGTHDTRENGFKCGHIFAQTLYPSPSL